MHGVFYCTRAALRLMTPRRSGKIVNIASIAGLGTGSTHSPGYSATKAGVISLTKTTALGVAGANIHVNAIACGGVLTPPFEDYLARASDDRRTGCTRWCRSAASAARGVRVARRLSGVGRALPGRPGDQPERRAGDLSADDSNTSATARPQTSASSRWAR